MNKIMIGITGTEERKKKSKYQTTCSIHPETVNNISDVKTHANHVEANNSNMRRRCSTYRKKQTPMLNPKLTFNVF